MSKSAIEQIINDQWDQHPSRSYVFVDDTRETGGKRVGTTDFLRHVGPMKAMLNALEERPRGPDPLRVLSAPCSIGCEPYSFAMIAKDDEFYDRRALAIDALDLSRLFVEAAREAIYPAAMIPPDFPAEMRKHFTQATNGMVRLTDEIKNRVNVLPAQDLTTLAPAKPYDGLIMLNLLIQLHEADIARRLADTIDRLNPATLLMNNVFLVKRKDGDRKIVPYEHWHMIEDVLANNGYVTKKCSDKTFPALDRAPRDLQKTMARQNDCTFLFVKPAF